MAAATVVGAPCGTGGASWQPPPTQVGLAGCTCLVQLAQADGARQSAPRPNQPPTCRLPSAGRPAPAASASRSAAAAPVSRIVERGGGTSGQCSNCMG